MPSLGIPNFRILHRVGGGGMGEVYAALDETLKRRVAVKVVRRDQRLASHARARFLREAQILSNLDHPNICRVYNYVESEGQDYLVLELIEGRNLRRALDGGLTSAERLSIATQIAQVLVATHAAGVVHRDLKPGNVMLTGAGVVKVLDFGLARSVPLAGQRTGDDERGDAPSADALAASPGVSPAVPGVPAREPVDADETHIPDSEVEPEVTRTDVTRLPGAGESEAQDGSPVETERGAVMGTLAYMSPEQARGEAATAASDLYSFGLLLQELFTGIPPYKPGEGSGTLLERARRGAVPPPEGLGTELTRLIQRLKSVAPSDRPTALDTLDRLRWIAALPARRVRWISIAAAVALVLLVGTKYSVDLARERTAAVQARLEADSRRAQAETLIGFMLGDLRKKLTTVGRLEILDDVGAKAMAYFSAVPETALTDNELADRSAALYQIGDVRISQGRLDQAVAPLAQSLALAKTLAERHPNDGKRLFDLAQSHFWVGFVEWRQRRLDAALVHFREYLRLAERMVTIDPKNADWRLELASANSNIGSVLEEQGHLDAALERFEATRQIEDVLLAGHPDDPTLRRAAASSNNTVGAVLRGLGRLDESLAHHRAELALQEDLVRRDPGNAEWRQYLSVSHNRVAMLLEAKGLIREAAVHAGRALDVIQRLAVEDASNVDWQRELARSHYRVGTVADGQGACGEAGAHLRQADTIMSRAAGLDSRNPARQRDLADVRVALAVHDLACGSAEAASGPARSAQQIADRLLQQGPDDRQGVRLRGAGLVLQGLALLRQGRSRQASEMMSQAVATLEPVARTSRDYAILDPWAVALATLGRTSEARDVVKELTAMGYREPFFVGTIGRTGAGARSGPTH